MSTLSGYPQLNFNNPFQRTRGPKMNAPTPQFAGGMFPTPPLRYGSAPMMTSPAITSSAPTMSATAPYSAPSPGPAPLPVGPSRYALDDAKNNIRTADTEHDAADWRMSHPAPQPGQIDVTGFPQINPIQWGMSHPAPSPVEVDHANYSEASRFNADAHARIAATPPLPREMFDQQGDIARAYAQAPVAVAEARGNAAANVADINQQGRVDAAGVAGQSRVDAAGAAGQSRENVAGINAAGKLQGIDKQQQGATDRNAATNNAKSLLEGQKSRAMLDRIARTIESRQGIALSNDQHAMLLKIMDERVKLYNDDGTPKMVGEGSGAYQDSRPRTPEEVNAKFQEMNKIAADQKGQQTKAYQDQMDGKPATPPSTQTEGYVNGVPPQASTPQNAAPRQVSSQQDYDAVPSGTPFTWNGKTFTKK